VLLRQRLTLSLVTLRLQPKGECVCRRRCGTPLRRPCAGVHRRPAQVRRAPPDRTKHVATALTRIVLASVATHAIGLACVCQQPMPRAGQCSPPLSPCAFERVLMAPGAPAPGARLVTARSSNAVLSHSGAPAAATPTAAAAPPATPLSPHAGGLPAERRRRRSSSQPHTPDFQPLLELHVGLDDPAIQTTRSAFDPARSAAISVDNFYALQVKARQSELRARVCVSLSKGVAYVSVCMCVSAYLCLCAYLSV
jgi:hypothetical protein